MHPGAFELLCQPCHGVALAIEGRPAGVVDQADLAACLGQPCVGVVFAQLQPILGPAGEHAVGLAHAFGDQVIHQHPQVGLVAAQRQRRAALGLQRSVGAGKQALGGGLFVAGGAVDLAGKEQAADGLGLEAAFQLAWVEVVVLDRVAGPQDVGVFQPGHRLHRGQLDVERQRGGNAVGVDLLGRQALGLQEDLVAVLVGEAVHLVFDAGAVARPHALDHASEHRAAVKARADDGVGAGIGVGDPARHLARVLAGLAQKAEHRHRVRVARLLGELREVDRAAVDARWRAGFQPALRQFQFLQAGRQRYRRRVTGAAGAVVLQADVDAAIQKGAGGQHHRLGAEADAHLRDSPHDPLLAAAGFHQQVVHRLLEQPQVRLVLQPLADRCLVQDAVGLGPRGAHGRALAAVEDAELDAGLVGGGGHRAAQRIHLLDQVALADAADRRVAAHLPQRLDVVGQQQRGAAHAGSGQRRFRAGMAATNDDDIKSLRVLHVDAARAMRRRAKGEIQASKPPIVKTWPRRASAVS